MDLKNLFWISLGTFIVSGIIFTVTLGLKSFGKISENLGSFDLLESLAFLKNPYVLFLLFGIILIIFVLTRGNFFVKTPGE